MQHQCTAALVMARQLPHWSVLPCKPSSQDACVTAITPMEICSSYRCAVMQHQCLAALVRAEQLPHCSVVLCKTGSQHACVIAIKNYGDLLFIQVCSDATPMHCSTGHGKTAAPLVSAALQTKLTGCLGHCNYTYGDLLFTQVCSDATPMHCSSGHGKTASPLFCAALQTKLAGCLGHCNYR